MSETLKDPPRLQIPQIKNPGSLFTTALLAVTLFTGCGAAQSTPEHASPLPTPTETSIILPTLLPTNTPQPTETTTPTQVESLITEVPDNIPDIARTAIENLEKSDLPDGSRVLLFATSEETVVDNVFIAQAGIFRVGDNYILRTAPHNVYFMNKDFKGRDIRIFVPRVGVISLDLLPIQKFDIKDAGFPEGQEPFGYIIPEEIIKEFPEDFHFLEVATLNEKLDNLQTIDALSGSQTVNLEFKSPVITSEPGLPGNVNALLFSISNIDQAAVCQGSSGSPIITPDGKSAFFTAGGDPKTSFPDPNRPDRSCNRDIIGIPYWQNIIINK